LFVNFINYLSFLGSDHKCITWMGRKNGQLNICKSLFLR